MHSLNFSDGFATIDQMVQFAGRIGLKKIAITDHSQAVMDAEKIPKKSLRTIIPRWSNVWNKVDVTFGVEGDILNVKGDICDHIQNIPADFLILSAHPCTFKGDKTKITQAYINAMKKHKNKITFIGHPCAKYFSDYVDIETVVKAANALKIPLEFNCANFVNGKTDLEKLRIMLKLADQIYVNSDAHTLTELRTVRAKGFDWLKQEGYIK